MKEGWTYKKLGEICNIDFGTRVVKSRDAGSIYPVYGGGGATFKMDTYNRENCMVISRFGMSEQCTRFVKGKFFLNDSGLTLSIKNKEIDQEFMNWHVFGLNNLIYSLGRGAAQKNLDTKALAEITISYPTSLSLQQQIVSRLDAAFAQIDALKANAEKQLNEARNLFQKALEEAMKPKEGWEEKALGDLGKFKNGMNFAHNESGCNIRILGVGDFGDKSSINDPNELSTISLNLMPSNDYLLKDEDVVFVRSNGNKQLVGRSVIVKTNGIPVTFSGFCIRFRNNRNDFNVQYLLYYLKTKETREQLFGNGANISNLSQKILQGLKIVFPSFSEQQLIASRLDSLSENVKKLEELQKKTIAECDALKQAMIREVFE